MEEPVTEWEVLRRIAGGEVNPEEARALAGARLRDLKTLVEPEYPPQSFAHALATDALYRVTPAGLALAALVKPLAEFPLNRAEFKVRIDVERRDHIMGHSRAVFAVEVAWFVAPHRVLTVSRAVDSYSIGESGLSFVMWFWAAILSELGRARFGI